jgi:iron-sulfur cluster repair protein YtfE (RIC family)
MPQTVDFKVLDDCHREIADHLQRLVVLTEKLQRRGIDPGARAEARAVEAFFSTTSRRHHADEESRVFPLLLASTDVDLVQKVRMLQQDHGWIEEDWRVVSSMLRAIAEGLVGDMQEELPAVVEIFSELLREHIALEESIIYPEARAAARKLERRRADRAAADVTAAAPSSS